jgi:putative membrane protein
MKTIQLTLTAAALLLGVASCGTSTDSVKQAQETNETKLDSMTTNTARADSVKDAKKDDSEFLTKAASGDMLEVQMGKEVAKRATNAGVRQAAEKMVSDHTKAGAELKALAAKKNLTLPTVLGDDQKKIYTDVLNKKGADMDKEYVTQMVKDHKDDIKEYQDAATGGTDPEVKAFAQKTVPTLQMHLSMFEKLQNSMDAKK